MNAYQNKGLGRYYFYRVRFLQVASTSGAPMPPSLVVLQQVLADVGQVGGQMAPGVHYARPKAWGGMPGMHSSTMLNLKLGNEILYNVDS